MSADVQLSEQVVEHVRVSHAALEKAKEELEKSAADKKAAQELIPGVVEALIKHRRIDASEREKAAQLLADPASALKVMLSVANPGITIDAPSLGSPSRDSAPTTKQARYLGQRVAGETEADRAFRERLLGS